MRRRGGWTRRAPTAAVVLVCVLAACLLFGAATHLADLARHGLSPYDWAPRWLNLYWSSLAVLDALAAGLLLGGRRWGVALTCAVVTTDLAANWYAVHGVQHGDALHHPGVQRLAAFTALVLATAPYLYRRLPPHAPR